MSKFVSNMIASTLGAVLLFGMVPTAAFGTEGTEDSTAASYVSAEAESATVVDQSDNKENSWRYDNGVLIVDEEDGASTLSASEAWSLSPEGYLSSNGTVIEGAINKGIDVSEHQGTIDWEKVKADGIDFVIIRCGYGSDYASQDDKYWEYNVSECERLGIDYGVYLYSYAQNEEMAASEAAHVLRLLEGHNPTYPVYYDMEDSSQLNATDNEGLARMATVFCTLIEEAGYEVGVYANLNWWNTYLTDSVFDNWNRWVAQYNSSCWYEGEYGMWQCTSSGSVDGVNGSVDINFDYDHYPADVDKNDWFVQDGSFFYVTKYGLLEGYGNGTFGAEDNLTRGQVATILWRAAGSPQVDATQFSDVDYGQYYGDAINWARETGVVSGYGDTNTFRPDGDVTREELAMMLANYAETIAGENTSSAGELIGTKADANLVSDWAWDAMSWAVDNGVITGIEVDGQLELQPQGCALRSQAAKMMAVFFRDVI